MLKLKSRSHLLFADDVIIFMKPKITVVVEMQQFLHEFAAVTGLQCNSLAEQVIDILQMDKGILPMKYLGVPLVGTKIGLAH